MAEQTSAFIRISLATKFALDSLGRKGESYETIVRRILDHYLEASPTANPVRDADASPTP